MTVRAQPYGDINGFIDHFAVLPDLEHNAVHPYNQVHRFQGTVLLGNHVLRNTGGDPADGTGRNIKFVNIFYMLLDIGYTHPFSVHGHHDLFQPLPTMLSRWVPRSG